MYKFNFIALLVLASASKAREKLLINAGIPHKVMISGIDESKFNNEDISQYVLSLAFAKAKKISEDLLKFPFDDPNFKSINSILGCDSVFLFEGRVFGKPKDKDEAINRLNMLSSKSGYLLTGHSLLYKSNDSLLKGKTIFDSCLKKVVQTEVYFSDLNCEDIQKYVLTGEPLNCAGGFSLEGRGSPFIRRIDGCFSNVIGLSLPWLRESLSSAGLEF